METKTSIEATTNFLYWTQNFVGDWIKEIWEEKDPFMATHLEEKFMGCYKKYGASASAVRFFFELDDRNKEKLLKWVDENYNYKTY